MAVAAFKRHANRAPKEVLLTDAKTRNIRLPPRQYLNASLDYLLEDAQKNMSLDGTVGLGAEEIIKEHGLFPVLWQGEPRSF
jgi:hypothetical protein